MRSGSEVSGIGCANRPVPSRCHKRPEGPCSVSESVRAVCHDESWISTRIDVEGVRKSLDLGYDGHATFVACWTAPDVDTGKPQKLFGHGLLYGFVWLCSGEQFATTRNFLPPISIGEQAVVADPHEAHR